MAKYNIYMAYFLNILATSAIYQSKSSLAIRLRIKIARLEGGKMPSILIEGITL
jgi:hypothetical protein